QEHGPKAPGRNPRQLKSDHSPHRKGEYQRLFDPEAVKQAERVFRHLRDCVRPRGLSGQPRPPVIENYASVIIFEKPDLPFPRRGACGKTAYEKERKSLAMDLIVEIDVPNVDEWHLLLSSFYRHSRSIALGLLRSLSGLPCYPL